MIRVALPSDLAGFVGRELAPGAWRALAQEEVDRFAALVGDRQWIHTDPERAARELAGGRTIVPGDLLLSVVPSLLQDAYAVEAEGERRLAALRRVRFRRPVAVGQRFRLRAVFLSVLPRRAFTAVETACRLEIEDGDAPALTLQRTDVFYA